MNIKKRVLFICAHPDDAELYGGGFIVKFSSIVEITVLIVSNGQEGANLFENDNLAEIRYKEAQDSANFSGFKLKFLNYQDGEIENTIHLRRDIIRVIREVSPHIIFTHKNNDYHPDHRHLSQCVQDSLVGIYCPGYLKEIQAIDYIPLVLFFWNEFKTPREFQPDVCIDISDVIEKKEEMLRKHTSQFNSRGLIEEELYIKNRNIFNLCFDKALIKNSPSNYNPCYAEAYEICEYITKTDREKGIDILKEIIQ